MNVSAAFFFGGGFMCPLATSMFMTNILLLWWTFNGVGYCCQS